MTTTVACPVCRTPVIWQAQSVYRPFCSERCQTRDLGAWAAEQHALPVMMSSDDVDEA